MSTCIDLNDPLKLTAPKKETKGLAGEVSIPIPETNDTLKQRLKLKIQKGEFTFGELIVPREVSM